MPGFLRNLNIETNSYCFNIIMSKEAFRFTGKDAASYEQYLGPLIFEPSALEILPQLVALPAKRILETSCGTGRLTRHLREIFPSTTRLTATDISADMLALAGEALKDADIEFKVADALQLPFDEGSFDLVVNQYGSMFFQDKQKGFAEAYRVLEPGGHFVFMTWDCTAAMPLFKLVIDDTVIPFFEGEDTTRFYTPFSLHDPEQLNDFLRQAGFRHNKVMHVVFGGQTSSPLNIVNGLFLKHPLGREVKEKDPASLNRIAAEMEQRIIRQFGTNPVEFELKALIGIGQK